jgi:hypothetical protein
MPAGSTFASFFMAGFECSVHRRHDGRRLDLLTATGHDRHAAADYRAVAAHGLRWHLIERAPGHYDWSSFLPMLHATREADVQAVWDFCHYGVPDGLPIWDAAFVDRFARFAREAARLIQEETGEAPCLCPVNEISYWAWAGGDMGRFYPSARGRGDELKRQLVRAAIAAIDAVREVCPDARFLHCEPLIRVIAPPHRPQDAGAAAAHHEAQYQAVDMLVGRMAPELGGRPEHLDLLGVNYYPDNQWFVAGDTIFFGHHAYEPLQARLAEPWQRYGRPLVVAETGAEGSARAAWLFYVMSEIRAAMAAGIPVEGVCLYPVLDYPGWDNERPCEVGLFGDANGEGRRAVHRPLAEELARQRQLLAAATA